MQVDRIDHINMTVSNFQDTADWYRRVFGFQVVEQGIMANRPWGVLRSGDTMLCVYEKPESRQPDARLLTEHKLHSIAHFGFKLNDRAAWETALQREGVRVTDGPWDYPHSTSWYIEDPNGYEIEVACWKRNEIRFDEA